MANEKIINKINNNDEIILINDARITALENFNNKNEINPSDRPVNSGIEDDDSYLLTSKFFKNYAKINFGNDLVYSTVADDIIKKDDLLNFLGLTNAMHYIGISSTPITDGGNENPTINGEVITPTNGDIVLYQDTSTYQEFIYNDTTHQWELLGDESAYKMKQSKITLSTSANLTEDKYLFSKIVQDTNGNLTATYKSLPLDESVNDIATPDSTKLPTNQAVHDYINNVIYGGTTSADPKTVATTNSSGTITWQSPVSPIVINSNGQLKLNYSNGLTVVDNNLQAVGVSPVMVTSNGIGLNTTTVVREDGVAANDIIPTEKAVRDLIMNYTPSSGSFSVDVINNNPTLSPGVTSTVGTINGVALTVTLPQLNYYNGQIQ